MKKRHCWRAGWPEGLVLVWLLGLAGITGANPQPPDAAPDPAPAAPTSAEQDSARRPAEIRVVIDFANGFEKHYVAIAYREGMTVLDALDAIRKHPYPTPFVYRGQGATAFLTEIDGRRNEGGTGKNWIFSVNDQLGKQSFALTPLQKGDTVLWRWQTYH